MPLYKPTFVYHLVVHSNNLPLDADEGMIKVQASAKIT